MSKILYSLLLLSATKLVAQVSAPFVVDFERHAVGPYTDDMSKLDFPQYNSSDVSSPGVNRWSSVPDGRAEIIDENGNKVLRVKYPAGCFGTDPGGCAIQIRWAFHKDQASNAMWASYRIKFEEGFEFVKGGKLPGLCGGQCYTGGNTPQQGDGWSARIMWRRDGDIVQYMYFTDQHNTTGDDFNWNLAGEQKRFQIGRWYDVATQVILNTVPDPDGAGKGHKNGIVRSWLDGEQVLEVDTVRYVDFADQKINRFYFSTFHGGSDNTWAPSKDVYVRFDDFRISTTPPEYLLSGSSSSSEISSSSSEATDPITPPKIANGQFRVQTTSNAIILENPPVNSKVEVYNLHGKRIYSAHPKNPRSLIIGVQTKGVYIVKVRLGNSGGEALKVLVM